MEFYPLAMMFVGPLMWVPFFNMVLGALVWGWPGFWTGLAVTMFEVLASD